MKRPHLWLALALLVIVNAVVLAGIARNRAGGPDADLTLTERELLLSVHRDREENTGLALRLDWEGDFVKEWFDETKLAELGFDVRPDEKGDSRAYRGARRALPKKAFVVLEYEGEAWRRFKEQKERELAELREKLRRGETDEEQAKGAQARIEGELSAGSRLFAVDAGLDPRKLRSRYPDGARYIIAPALVRMSYQWENNEKRLEGYIDSILVDNLHVPRDLAAPLLALPEEGRLTLWRGHYEPGDAPAPRYEVAVRWGRRYEPWVAGVRVIGGE